MSNDQEDSRQYTAEEKKQYTPPRCPECNKHQQQEWVETTAHQIGKVWMLGITSCPNPDCPRNNR